MKRRAEGRDALRKELKLDPSRPVILFASKLQTPQALQRSAAGIQESVSGCSAALEPYLVIVGDGEERAALEGQVSDSGLDGVRFCGFRNQSELPRFFDLATVFVSAVAA